MFFVPSLAISRRNIRIVGKNPTRTPERRVFFPVYWGPDEMEQDGRSIAVLFGQARTLADYKGLKGGEGRGGGSDDPG